MKKFIALFLSLLMMIPVLAACSDKDPSDTSDTDPPAESSADTVAETQRVDENGYLLDDLPETLNFGNEKFLIVCWDEQMKTEFDTEDNSVELIPNAINRRNQVTEQRLGVDLEFYGIKGNNSNRNSFIEAVSNSITTNAHEYDMVAAYSMCSASLSIKGCNLDLRSLDYLDFDKPWWPQRLTDEATVNDKLYFASGDISTNLLWSMLLMIYSKDMLAQYNIPDDLAKKVNNGEWTLDVLFDLASNVSGDIDGVEGKSDGDRFGFTTSNVYSDAFFFASGLRTVERTETGVTQIAESFGSEKTHTLISRLNTFFDSDNANFYTSNYSNATYFSEGKSLFELRPTYYIRDYLAGSSVKYGVLPAPKYDTDQESYVTTVGFTYTLYSVPADATDADMSAAVLECMASEAYRKTTPALFEIALKVRYSSDPESALMFDTIRNGISFDLGRIFCLEFTGKTKYATYNMFRYALVDRSNSWMSTYAEEKSILENTLNSIVSALE